MPLRHYKTSDLNILGDDNNVVDLLNNIFDGNMLHYHKINIMGREVVQSRSTLYFGHVDFAYSGQVMSKKPFPSLLLAMMEKINDIFKISCNSCLINYYANGNELIGHHSDGKGYVLLSNNSVVTVSIGASRKFELKNKTTVTTTDILLDHGDTVIMDGDFQSKYTHSIPKDKNVNGWRLSLTFRHLVG